MTGKPFDLVFLGADRINHPRPIELVMDRVRSRSLILAHNIIRERPVLAPGHDDPPAAAARVVDTSLTRQARLEAGRAAAGGRQEP